MYYCFLRGKRNELLAIRDSATKIQQSGTNIILEPVNDNFNEILTALNTVDSANNFILLANPKVGNLVNNTNILIQRISTIIETHPSMIIGLNVDSGYDFTQIQYWLNQFPNSNFALVHWGEVPFSANLINTQPKIIKNIFLNGNVSQQYIGQFITDKILLEDNFNRLNRNYDYQNNRFEFFSDSHLFFNQYGFQGFGNFSTVGDYFASGGSQPYTMAFHLTNNDPTRNNSIFIHHCLSDPRIIREDLSILKEELLEDIHTVIQNNVSILNWSQACLELENMYTNSMYAYSLGTLKRLSIRHHFELMHYLKSIGTY